MSRYLLLLLFNLPFVIASVLTAITDFKLNKSSRLKFVVLIIFWGFVLLGLIFVEPVYAWLFNNNLTDTEPLSLFDVIQITAIVITFYVANRTRSRVQALERKLRDLHRELSIKSVDVTHRTK